MRRCDSTRSVIGPLLGCCLWLLASRIEAQPDTAAPPASPVVSPTDAAPPAGQVTTADVDALKARLDGPEGAAHSEEQRKQIGALIQQSLEHMASVDKLKASAESFRARKNDAAADRDTLAADIAAISVADDAKPDPETTLATLETELLERRQQLTTVTTEFDAWLVKVQERPARRQALRDQLFAQPQQPGASQTSTGETPLMADAIRTEAACRKLKIDPGVDAGKAELAYYDTLEAYDIARLSRNLFDLRIAQRKREVAAWESAVQSKRQDAIARRIDAAATAAEQAPAPIGELYEQNQAIAREERTVRSKITEIENLQQVRDNDIADLRKRFDDLQNRDKKAAGSTALGLRLRHQRELLQDPGEIRHEVESRLHTVEQVRMTALDKNDQLEALSHVDELVAEYVAAHPAPAKIPAAMWNQNVTDAYVQRKEFLVELAKSYDTYADALDGLEARQEALASLTESVLTFIDERVLWIRSHHAMNVTGLVEDRSKLLWLVRGEWLQEPLRVLRADVWYSPGWYLLFLIAFGSLQLRRRYRRRRLEELARMASSRGNFDIGLSLQALAMTGLMSVSWPGLIWFIGFRLQSSPEATSATAHLGHSLILTAALIAILEFTRHFIRVDGLADAHFDWGDRVRGRLLSWVRWLNACGLPLVFLVGVLSAHGVDAGGDYIERLTFAIVLLLLAWALRDLMHPRNGIATAWTARHPGSWADRLRPIWSAAIVFVPVALCALILLGYYYTAQKLTGKLVLTLAMAIAVLVVHGLLVRWLMLRHRRLAIEQARARRAALAEVGSGTEESVIRVLDSAEQQANLSASSAQSQRLINTSLMVLVIASIWFVWADVLPALNYFNSTPVWPTSSVVGPSSTWQSPTLPMAPAAGTEPDASAAPLELGVNVQSVTWGDLIRALVVVILTVTAARNLPGLLEIAILERLPIDAAVRYAVQTFARYAIVVLGVVVVSNLLGMEWSKVQWLAAALTFGLAFGLQEIFANFISGLIILSEQPVRLGDIVTIDSISGIVSRIQMRSTTITDWDRKEYIVPNKEFITGKLLNWTLTDATNRIVISVGVGYGSDPNHVRRVLLEIAESHPEVLEEPVPSVTFDNFGDSALNFTLRAYLPKIEKRLPTIHDLHTAICLRFREEQIEIPFPQRDLNLRTLPDSISASLKSHGDSAA